MSLARQVSPHVWTRARSGRTRACEQGRGGRVPFPEDEIVATRAARPIAAVISMDGYWALRRIVEEIKYQLHAEAMESSSGRGW